MLITDRFIKIIVYSHWLEGTVNSLISYPASARKAPSESSLASREYPPPAGARTRPAFHPGAVRRAAKLLADAAWRSVAAEPARDERRGGP